MKIVLCLMMILSGMAAGYLKSRSYENRVLNLRDLAMCLNRVESEMGYRRDSLLLVFRRVGKRNENSAERFFFAVSEGMEENPGADFEDIWRDAAGLVYGENTASFSPSDMELLTGFGKVLGKTDFEYQKPFFSEMHRLLREHIEEAEIERGSKGKVYQGLYIAVSAAGAIILF